MPPPITFVSTHIRYPLPLMLSQTNPLQHWPWGSGSLHYPFSSTRGICRPWTSTTKSVFAYGKRVHEQPAVLQRISL